ncbi:unnamed protein product, partial [Meganyctiphanes norvegica]
MQVLSESTNGAMYTVIDNPSKRDSKLNMMMGLMDSLFTAIRHSVPSTPMIIYKETHYGGVTTVASGKFMIDDSLSNEARLAVYYSDLSYVGNTIKLTTPSGIIMSDINIQAEDGDANVIFVQIPSAERGEWQYQVENYADSQHGLHIQVTAGTSKARQTTLRVWTSFPNNSNNGSTTSTPIIIFAEVKEDGLPVLNARVIARLDRLDVNEDDLNYEPIIINLLDNGIGDTDITGDDGIYSRYLPNSLISHSGHYELSVVADDNNGIAASPVMTLHVMDQDKVCCSNSIQYNRVVFLKPFQRSVVYGVFNLTKSDSDSIPPSRITDLKAIVNTENYEVSLKWTAPGDDYDMGQAHHYEVVIADSWNLAKVFEGEKIMVITDPLPVSTEQCFTAELEKYDKNLYIAICAVDESGNRADISNIVSIWIPSPPTTLPPTTVVEESLILKLDSSNQNYSDAFYIEDMAIIIGSLAGCLVILLILACFILIHVNYRRRQQQRKENNVQDSNITNIYIKTKPSLIHQQEKIDIVSENSKQDDSFLKKKKSSQARNSYSASTLLREHERRFSTSSTPQEDGSESSERCQSISESTETESCHMSHSGSKASSSIHSDPPAYQTNYVGDVYPSYPYPYQTSYGIDLKTNHSHMPVSPRFSHASTAMTSENFNPKDLYGFAGELLEYVENSQIPYLTTQNLESFHQHPIPGSPKIPPPVAPKPNKAIRHAVVAAAIANGNQTHNRNVTLV